jgi:Uma2 family endonuclease
MIIPLKTRFLDLSEEEFFLFCQELSDIHIEREADGTIVIMELTGGDTGNFNAGPDFVIEIGSENDTVERLQAKMKEYQANGVRLGWLIDPQQEQVWMYRADGTIAKVDSFAEPLSGEDVLPGFTLDLAELWEPEG